MPSTTRSACSSISHICRGSNANVAKRCWREVSGSLAPASETRSGFKSTVYTVSSMNPSAAWNAAKLRLTRNVPSTGGSIVNGSLNPASGAIRTGSLKKNTI